MALRSISLRDFVIVRELTLDVPTGFTALTGETGAGKSILIDALQMALGARADTGMIREGASRTEVSVEFDCPENGLDWLGEAGFEADSTLLLRRTLDTQGRSRAWINGSPATATQLREIGDLLLDIHGQHAWQSLTRPEAVRGLLDAYAGIDTGTLSHLWQNWRTAEHALREARAAQDTQANERERLAWQIGEVAKLAPGVDEWDELNASHTRLAHAHALIEAVEAAIQTLEGENGGAVGNLSRAITTLADQVPVEPALGAVVDVLESTLAQAEDAVHSLHACLRRTSPDPDRLQVLDDRLNLWLSLARRYKCTPAELPAVLARWRDTLSRLDAAADLEAMEAAERCARQAFLEEALRLSKQRHQAASRLARAITAAMQELGMEGGRFEVSLQKLEQPAKAGLEEVTFLVAGHAGSTPRPVGKVASGGELSRIALAIAVTTSELGTAQTLIFDEVDAGIGGAVAETVGRLMKQLGRDRQVLAVTHLAQVASRADHHLLVSKHTDATGTTSTVTALDTQARVTEVARMLGGGKRSATTLSHAREMIDDGARGEHVRGKEAA